MFVAVLQVPSRVIVSEVCASPDALSGTLAPTLVTAVVTKPGPDPVVEMHTNVGKTAVIVLGTCPMLFLPPSTNQLELELTISQIAWPPSVVHGVPAPLTHGADDEGILGGAARHSLGQDCRYR
jgi:hypothetical protein